jgi:2-polyprenyl-6-methoxyphenol hydroxylase-like FAD-dependent oxidoreductase
MAVDFQNVLIVGGGPAGLATALMLAKRGWTKITVLEKRPAADYYEPDKSFNYLIDGRGQKFTDFLGLTDQLSKIGVATTEFYFKKIKPNGSKKTSKLPTVDPNRKTSYWLPRRTFTLLLYQEIERNWLEHITLIFNTNCVEIKRKSINDIGQEKIEVIARTESGSVINFEPHLLVGCDGINSVVRNSLKHWDETASDRFRMKLFPSYSSGLRYKVLSLPPNFPLDKTGKEHAICNIAYTIRGTFRGRKKSISLGLLPLKNPNEVRTANIITYPDHQVWELKNTEEFYNFFEKAFPQLPIREIISLQEAERFVKSEGGYFPIPQYCSGLYFLSTQQQSAKQAREQSSEVGIVLLGDAIHCFPPDIGQGVNSALEDVCFLFEALSKSDDNISAALPLYEHLRSPDVKALVHLAQIGFPWQYNQDPFRRWLWNINFLVRSLLSRLLPSVFSPPAFFLIQKHQLSYYKIWAMVQRTTQILYILGLILMFGYFAFVWKFAEI